MTLRLESVTKTFSGLHVDVGREIKMRYRRLALHRGPGDGFAHLAQRLIDAGRQQRRPVGLGLQHILLQDSPAGPGAANPSEVESPFSRQGLSAWRRDGAGACRRSGRYSDRFR